MDQMHCWKSGAWTFLTFLSVIRDVEVISDVKDTAQFLIFVYGIKKKKKFEIIMELIAMHCMKGTITWSYLFTEVTFQHQL